MDARSWHSDQHLVPYLLGLLPENEAERLDELSVTNDDIAGRLQVAEDDLIDAYVDGELSGEMLARFESICVSLPKWRERVSFAREFRTKREIVPVMGRPF